LDVFATFFDTGRLTCSLPAGRALRAAGFFAELFFFVGFAIALTPLVIDCVRKMDA
jgi:hypothetical protein